jgi:signal transduction histidine kinase
MTRLTVLIVDDSPEDREFYKRLLSQDLNTQYSIYEAETGEKGLEIVTGQQPDCILLDYSLPGMNGLEFVDCLISDMKQVFLPVIVLTSQGNELLAAEIMKRGAQDYVVKGRLTAEGLQQSLKNAVDRVHLLRLNEEKRFKLEEKCRELQESENRVRNILTNSAEGTVIVDHKRIVRFLNPAAESMFNVSAKDLVGTVFEYQLSFGETTNIEIQRKGGPFCVAELRVVDIVWEREIAYLVSLRDVTERQQLEEMKSNFITIVSHELRTPLSAIKNAVEIVAREKAGPVSEHQARFLSIASRNVDRLAAMINDVLDLSKIEAGKIIYRFTAVDLYQVFQQVKETFQSQADNNSIELTVGCQDESLDVFADRDRLEQILCNLLSNALKATPAGGKVSLTVERAPQDSFVEISVNDTGAGIRPEDQQRIFEPFHQVCEDTLTWNQKGTGLGLTITKNLVEAHHGRISVVSKPGQGSRFTFTLPVSTPDVVEMVALEKELIEYKSNPSFSVLVVEVGNNGMGAGRRDTALLDAVEKQVREHLPRSSDVIFRQPTVNRLVVVLKGTTKAGATAVKHKLEQVLFPGESGNGRVRRILGPSSCPEDGRTGRELIHHALKPAPLVELVK